MNFPDSLPPAAWFWSGRGLFVPVLLWAARTAPWRKLRDARPAQSVAGHQRGFDVTTALAVISETGAGMSRFATAGHFTS